MRRVRFLALGVTAAWLVPHGAAKERATTKEVINRSGGASGESTYLDGVVERSRRLMA